jgi:hypothetical protein
VALGYATARRWLARRGALLLAIGLGLGTGFWNSASQTLWQTETEAFGLAAAVLAFARIDDPGATGAAVVLGAGLALAGAARPQLGPAVGILLAGCWWRGRRADAALATAIVILGTIAICWTNWRWFGTPMGALPLLQDVNASLHRTGRTFAVHVEPYLGLLISPSRGLLVFSPIVAVALIGVPAACRAGSRSPLPWYALAFAAELVLYASYSVWWGGHTYGPRYLLDALPLLVPLAAIAMAAHWRWPAKGAAALALAWSIALAATGAFCYPHDAWNSDPTDIDRDHARLWSWSDPQFVRCWRQGASPQNFALLNQAALRRLPKPSGR